MASDTSRRGQGVVPEYFKDHERGAMCVEVAERKVGFICNNVEASFRCFDRFPLPENLLYPIMLASTR